MASGEEVVFAVKGYRPDGILNRIVVNVELAIGHMTPRGFLLKYGNYASEVVKYLFEIFCAPRVAYPWPEKAFNGFYFAIVESIIFGIADDFVISCSYIVDGKCIVALNHNFGKLNFLKELARRKAFLFESRQGNMIISCRARESKIISKLADNHVPIFFLKSLQISPDKLLRILSFGRNCYAAKHTRK